MGRRLRHVERKRYADLSEFDFFDQNQSSVMPSESELVDFHPGVQPLVEIGFEATDLVRMAITKFEDSSDEHIESVLGEYLADMHPEQRQEFWAGLISKAVKLAVPFVKKLVTKQGGKLANKIIKPKAQSTFQQIGKSVSTAWKPPANLPAGQKSGRLKRIMALLPTIIKMINELPENAEALMSSPQGLEDLQELSETLEDVIGHLTGQTTERYDLLEALQE